MATFGARRGGGTGVGDVPATVAIDGNEMGEKKAATDCQLEAGMTTDYDGDGEIVHVTQKAYYAERRAAGEEVSDIESDGE